MKKIFSRRSLSRQQGFLAVLAVFLIVVMGMMGIAAAYMFVGNATSQGTMQQSDNAFYVAETGLERAVRLVLTPLMTGTLKRIACDAVTGNTNLTAAAFGLGTFTVTTLNSSPIYTSTTLNGALTATATTIPVVSATGLSPAGTVRVDFEELSYSAISGNSLTGVQRGYHNSVATSHATAAGVSQYQCNLNVVAGTPNLSSPFAKRTLSENISLQEAWAAGNLSGANFAFTRWNRPTEVAWTGSTVSAGTAENLNGISMLSNAEGWAVGNIANTTFTLLHWKGTSWAATTAPAATCNTQNLNAVSAVSSQEAYAVGAKFLTTICFIGNYRYTILKWNGSAWTALTSATSPSIPADSGTSANLNAVHVIGTAGSSTGNLGFAVGDGGFILQFNGSAWTKVTSPTTQNLEGVYVVSATEAWAVGAAGVILKWNGTTWASVTSPTTTQLNAISMLDATQAGTAQAGFAVGNTGVGISYNGTSWSTVTAVTINNLNSVTLFAATDVWAVGDAGTALHWDGTSWTSIASGTTVGLNAISSIRRQPFASSWQEVFA
jgi:hypothetical protein